MGEPTVKFVSDIPDLIHPEEYSALGERRVVRARIVTTERGLEVIVDSRDAGLLDRLLPGLAGSEVEERLCG